MIDKKRLLRQFGLPTDQKQAFSATWQRQQDLFEDSFKLIAQVDHQCIHLTYTHTCPHKMPQTIWSLVITTSLAGRGFIHQSAGIQPAVSTLHRAAAIVSYAILQMQTNPEIEAALLTPPTQIKPVFSLN